MHSRLNFNTYVYHVCVHKHRLVYSNMFGDAHAYIRTYIQGEADREEHA